MSLSESGVNLASKLFSTFSMELFDLYVFSCNLLITSSLGSVVKNAFIVI